jgi:hypothetical protein
MIGTHKTTISRHGGMICVTYHNTDVVRFNDSIIKLDTGGYYTATTARRMNEASEQFGLGYHVKRERGEYVVSISTGSWKFTEQTSLPGLLTRRLG